MDKVIRNGKVAILYSPGFGAGWSTWNDSNKDFLLFDPDIVAAVQDGNRQLAADLAEKKGKEFFGEDDYTCVLGARDLKIEWVEQGEAFEITEYDGSEQLNIVSHMHYKVA